MTPRQKPVLFDFWSWFVLYYVVCVGFLKHNTQVKLRSRPPGLGALRLARSNAAAHKHGAAANMRVLQQEVGSFEICHKENIGRSQRKLSGGALPLHPAAVPTRCWWVSTFKLLRGGLSTGATVFFLLVSKFSSLKSMRQPRGHSTEMYRTYLYFWTANVLFSYEHFPFWRVETCLREAIKWIQTRTFRIITR